MNSMSINSVFIFSLFKLDRNMCSYAKARRSEVVQYEHVYANECSDFKICLIMINFNYDYYEQ